MATQIQYTELGGPEVLQFVEVPTPVPGSGEVVVETRAIGVNPIDSKLRSGLRPSPPISTPRVPGSDAAGVVVAVGDGVAGWSVGDEVLVRDARGAYASHLLASPAQLLRKPAAVSWEAAAALGIPVSTAHQGLRTLGLASGETLLVHAGSGAVGQAAIQLARHAGATVVATASPRNHDRVRELGAVPVAYGDGLVDRLRAAAPRGFDLAFDGVGTEESLRASAELVADRGRIGTIVFGPVAAELGVRGWMGGSPTPLTEQELAWRAEAYPLALDLVAAGELDVEIGARYPLTAAAEAQAASMAGGIRGKILLVP